MFRIRTKPDKAIPENEKITGESPHYFIQNIKLKTAAKMLRENEEYNISDISFQLGFSSLNYFGKSFKEYFGMSPTAYRKFHQEQKIITQYSNMDACKILLSCTLHHLFKSNHNLLINTFIRHAHTTYTSFFIPTP